MPELIKFTIDTLKSIQRFNGSLDYYKVPLEEWPLKTETGKRSMGIKEIVPYLLKNPNRIMTNGENINLDLGDGSSTFKEVCGDHHNALSDALACAINLFDEKGKC